MPTPLKDTNLFKPIKVGKIELKHRLVYAPSGRARASPEGVPTDSMKEYYVSRAVNNGGLLVAEGTFISAKYGTFPNMPLLSSEKDIAGWKQIVDGVHSSGSFIAAQLGELGRASVPALLKKDGYAFRAPSAVYIDEASEKAAKEAGNPLREFTKEELVELKEEIVSAAKKAIEGAGFDFVELHAAHMVLLNQFLDEGSNKRTDEYGGSIENRARFVLEVVDAVVDAIGADRVAIRISPYSRFLGGQSVDASVNPAVSYGYLLSELERRAKEGKRLAYVSFVEPRMSAGFEISEPYDIDPSWVGEIWKGTLMRAGGFVHSEGYKTLKDTVNGDDRTLIASSRYFTSNPDLLYRLRNGYPLTHYDRPTFYSPHTNNGYITWNKHGEEKTFEDIKDVVPSALA